MYYVLALIIPAGILAAFVLFVGQAAEAGLAAGLG